MESLWLMWVDFIQRAGFKNFFFSCRRTERTKEEEDDEMEGVGFSVKKKDTMKNSSGTKKKNSTKSKDN